jgi:hypothetical protein
MHYIEEVKGVQQVLDEEEEVAMQQGYVPPSTTGKGTIDTVEG